MSFSLDLTRAIENIKGEADRVVRGTLFSISARIIERTPVGNPSLWQNPPPPGYVGGSLRGGWQASIGRPDLSMPSSVDKNGSATIGRAGQIALSYNIGETYYLTNPLPYAYRVEYGWSQQAPQGMVRRSVSEAQAQVDKLAR